MLLGLLLLAHLAVRWFARGADPTLLPLAALLHGIGYVMITRLDDRLAGLQTTWSIVAIVAFVLTLLVVQRAPDLARYQWTLPARSASGCCVLPLVPGPRLQRRRRPHLGQPRADQLPARRVRQARPGHLLRRLPRRQPRADRRRHVEGRPVPPARAAAPAADRCWRGAFAVLVMVGRAGPRVVAAVLRPVRRDDVGGDRAGRLPRDRRRAVRRRRLRVVAAVRPRADRVDIWLDPWADRHDNGYQIVQALYGLADGGLVGTGLGRGSPDIVPEAPERLHLHLDRRGARPVRRAPPC